MILVVLIVFLCILAALIFWPTSKKTPNKKHADENAIKNKTIFVILPEFVHANIIDEIFATAKIPSRIFVGVGTPCPIQSNVRYLKTKQPFGQSIARQEIISNLYSKEDYILVVNQCSWFLEKNWDEKLIDVYTKGSVLTHWPVTSTKDYHNKTFPVFSGFVKNLPSFKYQVNTSSATRSFRILMATLDCCFAQADIMINLLEIGLPYLSPIEENLLFSLECFQSNYPVFNLNFGLCAKGRCDSMMDFTYDDENNTYRKLTHGVVQHLLVKERSFESKKEKNAKKEKTKNDSFQQNVDLYNSENVNIPLYVTLFPQEKTTKEFFDMLGIDMDSKEVAGRAFLGLLANYDNSDILARFDSMKSFYDQKFRVSRE